MEAHFVCWAGWRLLRSPGTDVLVCQVLTDWRDPAAGGDSRLHTVAVAKALLCFRQGHLTADHLIEVHHTRLTGTEIPTPLAADQIAA